MSSDHERDSFGNIVNTSHHTQFEGKQSGVIPGDSAEVGRMKVQKQREIEEASRAAVFKEASAASGGPGIFVGVVLVIGFGLVCKVGASFSDWQRNEQAEVIDLRSDLYSDFAPIDKWPVSAQDKYRKYQHRPLRQILIDVPKNREKIPDEKKADYGAQIWFAASSHGKETHQYVTKTFDDFLASSHKWIGMEAFVLEFLHGQCKSGVVAACLDAAKIRAGAIFETTHSFDAADADKKAMAELPATGPSADAPEVVELRQRISRGPRLQGWDYLASLYQKVAAPFR